MFDKSAPSPINNCFQRCFKSFLVHFSVLSIFDDVKHIVYFFILFDWYHKMVSPQNDDTMGAPPPPSNVTAAAALCIKLKSSPKVCFLSLERYV